MKFWAVFRGSEWFSHRNASVRGWCWRIKKGIAEWLSPKMGTKKGKGIPIKQDTLARNCVKQLS